MSRGSTQRWRTFTLNEDNEWTAEWDDDGYPASFAIYRENNYVASGSSSYVVSPDGNYLIWYTWRYTPTSTYDSTTHSFTQTNVYTKSTAQAPATTIVKSSVDYDDYTYPDTLTYTYGGYVAPFDHYLDDLLQRDTPVIIKYTVTGNATTVAYTRDEQFTAGAKTARVVMRDTDGVLQASGADLVPGADYEIASVTAISVNGYVFSRPNDAANWTIGDAVAHDFELWGETADGNVCYARKVDGALTGENGATVSGTTVTLPSGVHRVWFESTTSKDRLILSCTMSVRLFASDHMKQLILDSENSDAYTMLGFQNTANMKIFDESGTQKFNASDSAIDYLHGKIPHPTPVARVTKTGLTYLDSTWTNTSGRWRNSSYYYDYEQDFLADALLHRDETVDLSYDVSGSVDITPYTLGEGLDGRFLSNYGKRSATAVLNDGVVQIGSTTLTPGVDYLIASITLSRASTYEYARPYQRAAAYGFLNASTEVTELWGETTDATPIPRKTGPWLRKTKLLSAAARSSCRTMCGGCGSSRRATAAGLP